MMNALMHEYIDILNQNKMFFQQARALAQMGLPHRLLQMLRAEGRRKGRPRVLRAA